MTKKRSQNKVLTVLFWLLHIGLLALLFMPMQSLAMASPNMDKVMHAVLFVPVSVVSYLYLGGKKYPIAIGLAFYAFLIEVGQDLYTSTRFFEWSDWFFGALGIVLGMGIISIFTYFRK